MNKFLNILTKIAPGLLIITLLFYVFLNIIQSNEVKAAESYRYTYDGNNLDTNKYPGVKEKIDILKRNHPNWTFTIMETGLEWDQVIKAEYSGHWSSPKNLIQNKSGSWICSICGDHPYDNGSWRCASEMTIRYYMDSRNWLVDNEYLFQFLQIDYKETTNEQIYNALANTFLHSMDYATQINEACRESNVNPYYIVARLIQEQGMGGGSTWKMESDGVTYYNLFNIGASGNSPSEIYNNALATAKARGWTSVKASIKGGVSTMTDYINARQNTQYLNKFDVEPYNGTYWKQYMQNIEAPKNEASKMYSCMKKAGMLDQNLNFIIPVFLNMPTASSPSPDGVGEISPKNIRVKEGHSEIIIRTEPTTASSILYVIPDSSVVLLSVERLNNGWHKVVLTDGRCGYIKFNSDYLEEIDDVTNCYETKMINADSVPMHVGPGSSQTLLTTLSTGQLVTRIDNTGRYSFDGTTWDRILLADGRQGFVERKYLQDIDASQTFTVSADLGLFLRSSPSIDDSNKIRLLSNGTVVTRIGSYTVNGVEATSDGYYWDYIITGDGAKGYVARDYLRDMNGNLPGAYGKVKIEINEETKQIIISENANFDHVKEKIGQDWYITRADGSTLDSNLAKTGDRLIKGDIIYTVVKTGDCNGDGYIKASDYLMIKDYIMGTGTAKLEGVYKDAADVTKDKEVKASDYLKIKDHIMYGVEV